MSSRLARRCLSVCNGAFLMLQRTRRLRCTRYLLWVHAALVVSLGLKRIGPIALRVTDVAVGVHLRTQLSQRLLEKRSNFIGCTQGAKAWDLLRVSEVPLVLGDLDEVADRRVAHPGLPQRSTGQRRGNALLQKGGDVAASNDGFDWWQARHIEGCCKRFFVCGGCRPGLGFGRSRAWLGGLAT